MLPPPTQPTHQAVPPLNLPLFSCRQGAGALSQRPAAAALPQPAPSPRPVMLAVAWSLVLLPCVLPLQSQLQLLSKQAQTLGGLLCKAFCNPLAREQALSQ